VVEQLPESYACHAELLVTATVLPQPQQTAPPDASPSLSYKRCDCRII
jgi:hypothetical protein